MTGTPQSRCHHRWGAQDLRADVISNTNRTRRTVTAQKKKEDMRQRALVSVADEAIQQRSRTPVPSPREAFRDGRRFPGEVSVCRFRPRSLTARHGNRQTSVILLHACMSITSVLIRRRILCSCQIWPHRHLIVQLSSTMVFTTRRCHLHCNRTRIWFGTLVFIES